MTFLALTLVLIAAVLHAVWNLAAKRAGGGLPFVFATGLVINALYLPVVAIYWWWRPPDLPWSALAVIGVSALLKTAYSLCLQRGYRTGEFSVIYPLARGTGPLLAVIFAVLILGERPHPSGYSAACWSLPAFSSSRAAPPSGAPTAPICAPASPTDC